MFQDPNTTGGAQAEPPKKLSQYLDPKTIVEEVKSAFATNFNPKDIIDQMGEIDKEAMNIAKSFGVGRESMGALKSAIANARDGVFSLGGGLTDIVKTQNDAAKETGRNITLTADAQKELYAAMKVTDLSVSTMVKGFKDVGISSLDVGKQMTKITNIARESGVSAKEVSKKVVENLGAMNMYNFKDGVEGMAKMAAQATSMRIEMKTMLDIAEKVFDPKGAIEMAASLQRLGVTQSELLDPLSLMNMAENDPAELQNQIADMSKQFVQMNKDGQFEILPGAKRQMREIAKALGMSTSEFSKMALASAETEEKMKRIKFPDFATEEQKKLLANVTEMKDGVMKIQVDGKEMNLDEALKNVSSKEELEKLIGATEKKDITELAQEQLDVLEEIKIGLAMPKGKTGFALSTTKTGESIVRGMGTAYKKTGTDVADLYGGSTGDLSQYMKKTIDPFAEKLKNVDFTSLTELDKISEELGKTFKGIISDENREKAKEKLKKLPGGETIIDFNYTKFGEEIVNALKMWTKIGNDVLVTPEGAIKFNPEDTILAGTGLDVVAKMLEKPNANVEGNPMTSMLAEMTKTKPPTETTTATPKEGSKEFKIDLNVNITAPPQVDTAQVVKVLKDQFVIQQLIEKMEQVSSNNNLTKMPK
jgi:hypothetical protein